MVDANNVEKRGLVFDRRLWEYTLYKGHLHRQTGTCMPTDRTCVRMYVYSVYFLLFHLSVCLFFQGSEAYKPYGALCRGENATSADLWDCYKRMQLYNPLHRGLYADQLERWFRVYDRSQVRWLLLLLCWCLQDIAHHPKPDTARGKSQAGIPCSKEKYRKIFTDRSSRSSFVPPQPKKGYEVLIMTIFNIMQKRQQQRVCVEYTRRCISV